MGSADTPPAEMWMQPGFDDRVWPSGPAPFGDGAPEGVPVRTRGTTPDIWMRQPFEWRGGPATGVFLLVAHDEDALVYINGVEAASVADYSTGYVLVAIGEAATAALKPGTNTIAVRCQQTKGAQAIDVGLVQVATGLGRQRSIVQSDAGGPQHADFLEVQRSMRWISLEEGVAAIGQLSDVLRQLAVTSPEPRGGEVSHSSRVRPAW